jgi:hypothetical protein
MVLLEAIFKMHFARLRWANAQWPRSDSKQILNRAKSRSHKLSKTDA